MYNNSILIADDDELVLESLSDSLMYAGYRTTAADSVSRALDLLEKQMMQEILS